MDRRAVELGTEVYDGFRAAIEIFRRHHAPWEESAAQLYWAQALFAASQLRASMKKFGEAYEIFDRIGTPRWREQIERALFRFMTLDTLASPLMIGDENATNLFRKEGDYWTVSYHGTMFRMRDSIGMHYIGRLLAAPGSEFASADLVDLAYKAKPRRSRAHDASSPQSRKRKWRAQRRRPVS